MQKRIFYVYMSNNTSHHDDEVFKVKATSEEDAKKAALSFDRGRFSCRWVKSAADTEREYKWWATDYTRRC